MERKENPELSRSQKFQKLLTSIFAVLCTGVIANAIFTWTIQPLTVAVWNGLASSSSSYLQHLQDAAILNAALGKRDWVSVTLLFIFLQISLFFVIASTITALSLGPWLKERMMMNPKLLAPKSHSLFFLRAMLILTAAILTILFAGECFLAYTDMQLNTSFYQRLDALGPYISDREERQLKSSWALMQTRAQYNQINSRIEEFASRAKINIPQPLYK